MAVASCGNGAFRLGRLQFEKQNLCGNLNIKAGRQQ